jgi:uncharacterized protein CbrC (UPF0167 family)
MKPEKFREMVYKNSKEDYGMCPPPIDAQSAFNVLMKHFLGDDWYTTMPMCQEQVNAEVVYEILEKYPGYKKKTPLRQRLRYLFFGEEQE